MATRPGDWSAVGLSGDPTPGDPAVINRLADAMHRLAETAGTIHDGLNALQQTSGEGQRFIGKTADALRGKVDEHLNKFAGSVRESFLMAETALRTYATAVGDAQTAAGQALTAAQGLAQDDPQRQTLTERASAAHGTLATAVTQLTHQLHEAGERMQQPTSACETFWKVFEIFTIIFSVLAIFTGGLLGIIAWAMNAIQFIKVAVDFSQGKATGLQLGLAFLGMLFPSTKGIGGTLKAIGKGILASGKGFMTQVGRIALMTGTSRLVVAPLLLASKLGGGLRGFLPMLWNGVKGLGRAGLEDWAKITGGLNGGWAKAGAYGAVTLQRLGRFMVAALVPLNFTEIGVLGFRGAAALAFGDRVLGIPQYSLRQMMARAGDLEYLMKAGAPAAGAGHGAWSAGRAGEHLGAAPFGGLRFGPGFGSVSTDLFHLSLTRTPALDFTQLGFAKLGDVLMSHPGAAAHTGTSATPGLHAVSGLVTPSMPGNFTLGKAGLAVPASAAGDSAITSLTHLDASLGQVRLDSNLLLPADTALGVVQGARHPSGLSLLTDVPVTGHGVEAPGGLAQSLGALDDGNVLARSAIGHVEDFADLKLPELMALQQGDVTVRGITGDGISLRIGRETDVTVNAQSLTSLAAGSHGGVPHAAPSAAVPHTGGLPGTAAIPDGAVANAASHTAAPHGGVPGALAAQPVPPVTTHVASPPHGAATPTTHGTAHAPSGTALKDTAPQVPHPVKGADAPAPVPAANSREQALALLKGDDARPRGAGLSATADTPVGGVSSRSALDAAGVSPSRVDTQALDLVARPGRPADAAGELRLAQAAPQPPAPQPVHAGAAGEGAAPLGHRSGPTDVPAGPGDVRPPRPSGQASALGPAAPVPTRIEGHAAATVRNQLRLSIGHVITGGAADGATAELRMQRFVAYEHSLADLRTAQRDAGAGAPRTPGAGPSTGPSRGQSAAAARVDAAVAEVVDARRALREIGVDPDAMLNEVRTLNVRTVLEHGGTPGGAERPDLSRVLADEAADTSASSAGHISDDLTEGPLDDLTVPDGGPLHGGAAPEITPVPPARHEVTVGHVENRFAQAEGRLTSEFVSDPLAFLGRQPLYGAFEVGMAQRMPGLTQELANRFLQTMDDATQHWFVLVRAGDAGAREGTLLLTPAVERYAQAFANGELFHTPHVTQKVMDVFEELTRHPALPRPMAADNYLASGYIPYQGGVAKGASTIGNTVIRRNPGTRVGAEFVFTPEMTGCALAVTDVTDDTFRAWHYQSPNGMSQRQFAAAFRAERSPTDWFGDASYLGPMPDGYRNGATNILWRREDGSWHILSHEYRAPLNLELGAFTLPREPFAQPLRLTPGNELAYTKKIYDGMRGAADTALQKKLLEHLQTRGIGPRTLNELQEVVLEPITRTLLGEDAPLAKVTNFEELATTVTTLKAQRQTTAKGVRRALDDLAVPESLKSKIEWSVGEFENSGWLTAATEAEARIKAGTHVVAEAQPPVHTGSATVTEHGGAGPVAPAPHPSEAHPVPPAVHPGATSPTPSAGHLADDAAAPAAPASGGKGKGRADAQEHQPLLSSGGRADAQEAARVMQERIRVRQEIITGGATGPEAEMRLTAWDAYEFARTDLGRPQEGVARDLHTGPSTGPTRSQQLLQAQRDAAEAELAHAEDRLRELGIDPRATSDRIDESVARIRTGDGTALGGSRRGELPHTDAPQTEPVHLADEATDSGAPAGGLDEAVPDEALPGVLDETVPGPAHAPEPVAVPVAHPVPAVGHVDNPFGALEGARSEAFVADPVQFLDAHPVTTEISRGIRERMPGLSLGQSNAFTDQMGGWSRHWFVLHRDNSLPLSHRTMILTPAVERYVQAFDSGELFPDLSLVPRQTRELFDGLRAHPGLLRPLSDDHYLASHFIPYKTGIAKEEAHLGSTVIPRTPQGGNGSAFVFTPEMNGCAIAVTDVTDDTFKAWHYQSPGGEAPNAYATRFRAGRRGTDFNGPPAPEHSVRDWVGDAMYLTPELSSRRWKGATNVLWHRSDGTWHVLSQEYRATATGRGLDDVALRRTAREFPLDLTGGGVPAYTRRIYDGMRIENGLEIEGELVSALAALRSDPRLAGSLQRSILDRVFATRLTEETRLAAAGDFPALVETAQDLGRQRLETATSIREVLDNSALDAPLRDRLNGIVERFGNPRWTRELEREAQARLDALASGHTPAPTPTPEMGTLRISEPAAGSGEGHLPVARARDAYAEAYAERGRAQFELNEWNQRFAGGAGPSSLSSGPSQPELRLAAAEDRLHQAGEELRALGVDPQGVRAEIEETITRSGKESKGLPGGMRRTDPGEGSSGTGLPDAETSGAVHEHPVPDDIVPDGVVPDGTLAPAATPHAVEPAPAPVPTPLTNLAPQDERLTRAFVTEPEAFFTSHVVSVRFDMNIASRSPWLNSSDIAGFLDKLNTWEGRHWFVIHQAEGRSARDTTVMLTPAVEKYIQVNADRAGLAKYADRRPPVARDGDYLSPVFLPYMNGLPEVSANGNVVANIGTVRVPRVPGEHPGSELVVTPTMNGCALAVTNVDETGFTAWHFQSPGSSQGADMRFRLHQDRQVVDWFGDAEYETPVKRGQYQAANMLWHDRSSGQWKILSQESDMLYSDRGAWLGLSRTNDLTRDLRLEPGGELTYTKTVYEGLETTYRQRVDRALIQLDDKAVWSKDQYKLLTNDLIAPYKRRMDEFRRQLAAQPDFAGLAELARVITERQTLTEENIGHTVESWTKLLKPLESQGGLGSLWGKSRPFEWRMDNLLAFLREYHNVGWAEQMRSEALGRLAPPPHPGADG
ncbi:hypothetical protein IPZ58_13610 [Streptomyces roseoverticillatus]|uniref:hypothetical protein n=1 Tax=Streptomyces roseoverticillatus TaxID=66429 RepID=UPI001F3FDB90|nr:hypothetical protein [Streptomyces roseoverticillatus]MCF3102615.1 hypothetical protein [Streptomyces roseoverticillatus]